MSAASRRRTRSGSGLIVCLLVSATGAFAQECTREGLSATIDQYFAALLAHDPIRLPLASEVKFTENGQVIDVGEGFWQTAGRRTFHRNILDTTTCGTMTQAIVEENGQESPAIFGVRLRMDDPR